MPFNPTYVHFLGFTIKIHPLATFQIGEIKGFRQCNIKFLRKRIAPIHLRKFGDASNSLSSIILSFPHKPKPLFYVYLNLLLFYSIVTYREGQVIV